MSYSQRVTWKQSQGCKQCQMLPQRYRYVQLRKQITYVGSTSQACIFRSTGQSLPFGSYFFWIGCIVFSLIRIELNQIVCLSIRGTRWMLANERFQTTGRTALWALTLACLMPVRPIYHLSAFRLMNSTHGKRIPELCQFMQWAYNSSGQVVSRWPTNGQRETTCPEPL